MTGTAASVITPSITPRRSRRHERMLDRAYPDALDLLVVAVHAGMVPSRALDELRPWVHPAIRAGLDDLRRRTEHGARFADALDVLVDHLGARALALTTTLAAAERTGAPLAPVVERIADDARQHRRRLVEQAARELPVRLTLPLALCTLPSFLLIAIAPLVLGALSSLSQ